MHRQVVDILAGLDRNLLEKSRCYFAGGTRIVLELDEYRESKDMDFVCSSQEGYRTLREGIVGSSLGAIMRSKMTLAREVRADQYGIRTFIERDGAPFKFEIIREARIDVSGEEVPGIPVTCLSRRHCFAEKFLANADRGLDTSTLSRDLVDLAFMIQGWSKQVANEGMVVAEAAYGEAIKRSLAAVIHLLRENKPYRNRCIEGLAIENRKSLATGIRMLGTLVEN